MMAHITDEDEFIKRMDSIHLEWMHSSHFVCIAFKCNACQAYVPRSGKTDLEDWADYNTLCPCGKTDKSITLETLPPYNKEY